MDGKPVAELDPLVVAFRQHQLSNEGISVANSVMDLDEAVFQYLLVKNQTGKAGFYTDVEVLRQELEKQLDEPITATQIKSAVENTRYTQRDFMGNVTGISPYQTVYRDKELFQVLMPTFVSDSTSSWGW